MFLLTKNESYKLSAIIILGALLFGVLGVLLMLIFQFICRNTYSIAEMDKHGISHVTASRYGGITIFLSLSAFLAAFEVLDYLGKSTSLIDEMDIFVLVSTSICVLLGLFEDFNNNSLSPRIRLLTMSLLFGFIIYLWPALVPLNLGISYFDVIMNIKFVGWFLTVLFCVGFVNSVNMADGANGLIPGIMTIVFGVFYLQTGMSFYAIVLSHCALFALFNIISGRLFLGDAGSYGLGALSVISALHLYSSGMFSSSFLACLFAYPCIDFVVTICRRKINGRAIMQPDNDHLHNRLNYQLKKWVQSKTLANSMTGLVISVMFSGLAFFGFVYNWWQLNDHSWIYLFLFQCLLYLVLFFVTGFKKPSYQFVVKT